MEAHKFELLELISKFLPHLSEEEKSYLATLRIVDIHGFNYSTGNTTDREIAFVRQIETIYENSGMNALVDEKKHEFEIQQHIRRFKS